MCVANSQIQVVSRKNTKEGLKSKLTVKKKEPEWAKPPYVRDLPHRKCNGKAETFKIVKTGKRVQLKCNHATRVIRIVLGSILMMLLRVMSELTCHLPENLPAACYQHCSTCMLISSSSLQI